MFTKTRLPQYFFGDDDNQEDTLASNESNFLGVASVVEDFHISEPNLSRISSPASSLASNKRLEWDSGADIGYNNAYNSFKKSRRSRSFPSLNMDLSISQINKSDETTKNQVSEDNSKNIPSTSKSKSPEKKKSIFTHSTPYEEKITSKSSKSELKETKSKDECLQTTLVHICSKSVQTENKMLRDDQKVNRSQQTDTVKSQSTSSGSSLSKSSSFQYIACSDKSRSVKDYSSTDKSECSNRIESGVSHSNSSRSKESKIASKASNEASNLSKSSTQDTKSSSTSPLGKIIATQQSTHLITDIDRSLQILNKFIKSKNYNSDTKKHYARKIVNKIITSKYSEDNSSSSTNKSDERPIEPNIKIKPNKNPNQRDFDKNQNDCDKNQHDSDENKHDFNKSRHDFDKSQHDSDSRVTLKPKTSSCGVQCDPTQKTASTGTKQKLLVKKIEEIIYKNEKFTRGAKTKSKSDIDLSNKSWKNSETLSEKLFEARRRSLQSEGSSSPDGLKNIESQKGDYIIQHSRNERKRQLSWINNEITYLHKLKELLQKHDTSTNTSPSLNEQLRPKTQSWKPRKSGTSSQNMENLSEKSSARNRPVSATYTNAKSSSSSLYSGKALPTNKNVKSSSYDNAFPTNKNIESSSYSLNLDKASPSNKNVESSSNSLHSDKAFPTDKNVKSLTNSLRSDKSLATNRDVNSAFSDIESRFYREFGSVSSRKVSENLENLRKLSRFLTTNQIKSLIGNKDKELHCPTCECCKEKDVSKNEDISKSSHERHNSFDSHRYNSINSKNKIPEKTETAVQCTLQKKKIRPQTNSNNTSTEYAPDENNVKVFYKNCLSETPSTEYGGIEAEKTTFDFAQTSKRGKENYQPSKHKKSRPKTINSKLSKPVAYFLTFEEESMKEFYEENLRPPLKNVTVKVPKIKKSSSKMLGDKDTRVLKSASENKQKDEAVNEEEVLSESDKDTDKESQNQVEGEDRKRTKSEVNQGTLQEYLTVNRPDFVKSANWRRRMIYDQADKKSRNIFTCAQMKKQTIDKYKTLPEVQNKLKMYKYMSEKCHNRCMANVFAKKLQKKTLKGEVSIATCVTVMSSDS